MADRFVLTAAVRFQSNNLDNLVREAKQKLRNVKGSVNISVSERDQRKLNQAAKRLKAVRKDAQGASQAIEAFGKSSALAIRRFGAFVAATFAIRNLTRSIKDAFSEAIQFERELVKIAQVNDRSIKSLKGLTSEITRLSTQFGVSSAKLLQSSRILSQTGLSAEKVRVSLQALAKSDLAPTFNNINQTTEASIAIFRQFKLEAQDLERVLGSINAVAGRFAVEAEDINVAVRRTGGVFAAAGGQIEELIALFTSVRATTRESAESIATGFRTIFTRLQRTRTINFLDDLGIQLRDAEGQFVGPLNAIRALSTELNKLRTTDPRFAQIVEELGGFRQVSKVIPLIKQFDTAQSALNVAIRGGDSLTRDAARAQESLAVQIQKTREEFVALIREFTDTSTFRALAEFSLTLARSFIQIADSIKPLLPLISILGTVAAGNVLSRFFGGSRQTAGFNRTITGLQSGGKVPGVGTGDKVPALLEPGEFVVNKRAVQSIGANNLSSLNNGIARFQTGGLVGTLRNNPAASLLAAGVLTQIASTLSETENSASGLNSIFKQLSSGISGALIQFVALQTVLKGVRDTSLAEGLRGFFNPQGRVNARARTNAILSINRQQANLSRFQQDRNQQLRIFDERRENVEIARQERVARRQPFLDARLAGFRNRRNNVINRTNALRRRDDAIDNVRLGDFRQRISNVRSAAAANIGINQQNVASIDEQIEAARNQPNAPQLVANLADRRSKELITAANTEKRANEEIARIAQERTRAILEINRRQIATSRASDDILSKSARDKTDFILEQNRREAADIARTADLQKRLQRAKAGFILDQGREESKLRREIQKTNAQRLRAEQAIAAREQRLARIGRAVQIGTVGATIAGGFLSSRGSANIQAGDFGTGRAQSAVGGALVRGGIGATLGFEVAGPLGAVVGGVIGGLTGLVSALKQAEAEIKEVKLAKEFETLNKTLEDINKGRITQVRGISGIRSGLQSLRGGLNSASTNEERQQARGRIRSSALPIEQAIRQIARTSSTFEEFETKVGKDTIRTFNILNNQSISKFNEEIRKSIEARQKETQQSQKLIQANLALETRIRNVVFLTNALEDAAFAAQRFDNVLTNISNPLGTTSTRQVGSVLGRSNVSQDLFNAASRRTVGLLGNTAGAQALGSEARLLNQVSNVLPDILLRLRSSDPLGQAGTFSVELGRLLSAELGPGSDVITDLIVRRAEQIIGSEGKDAKILNDVRNDLPGLLESLTKDTGRISSTFAKASSLLEGQINRYGQLLSKTLEFQSQITDRALARINVEEQRAGLADIGRVNNTFNLARAQRFDDRRQRAILGPNRGLANNVPGLLDLLTGAQNNIRGLTARRDALGPNAGIDSIINLNTEINEQQLVVQRVTRALEFLADSTNRTRAAQQKLAQVQENRRVLRNFATQAVFSGLSNRRNLARSIAGATFLGGGGRADQLPASLLPRILSLLQSLGQNRLGALGGRTPQELIRDVLVQQGIPREIADAASTTQEQRLIDAIRESQDRSVAALQGLQDNLASRNAEFIRVLEKSLKDFTTNLERTLLAVERRRLSSQIGQLTGDINQRRRLGQNLEVLNRFGVSGANVEQLSARGTNILDLSERLRTARSQRALLSGGFIDVENDINARRRLDFLTRRGRFTDARDVVRGELQTLDDAGIDVSGVRAAADRFDAVRNTEEFNKFLNAVTVSVAKLRKETDSEISEIAKGFVNAGISPREFGRIDSLTQEQIKRLRSFLKAIVDFGTLDFDTTKLENSRQTLQNQRAALPRNSGGIIPGVGNTDTVSAMLTPGEFVLRKEAVERLGVPFLEGLNNGTQGFQRGGLVRRRLTRAQARAIREQRRRRVVGTPQEVNLRNARFNQGLRAQRFAGLITDEQLNRRLRQVQGNPLEDEARRRFFGSSTPNRGPGATPVNTPAPVDNRTNNNRAATGQQQAGQARTNQGVRPITANTDEFVKAVNTFASSADGLTKALNDFPREIQHNFNGSLEIIVNGGDVLAKIMPQVREMVELKVVQGLNRLLSQRFPGVQHLDEPIGPIPT